MGLVKQGFGGQPAAVHQASAGANLQPAHWTGHCKSMPAQRCSRRGGHTWKASTTAELALSSLGAGSGSSAGRPGGRRTTRFSVAWLGKGGCARMPSWCTGMHIAVFSVMWVRSQMTLI